MKRGQNAGIALARIKMSFAEVKERISLMDDEIFTTDQLRSLSVRDPDHRCLLFFLSSFIYILHLSYSPLIFHRSLFRQLFATFSSFKIPLLPSSNLFSHFLNTLTPLFKHSTTFLCFCPPFTLANFPPHCLHPFLPLPLPLLFSLSLPPSPPLPLLHPLSSLLLSPPITGLPPLS